MLMFSESQVFDQKCHFAQKVNSIYFQELKIKIKKDTTRDAYMLYISSGLLNEAIANIFVAK